jgi:hypothetical protein
MKQCIYNNFWNNKMEIKRKQRKKGQNGLGIPTILALNCEQTIRSFLSSHGVAP